MQPYEIVEEEVNPYLPVEDEITPNLNMHTTGANLTRRNAAMLEAEYTGEDLFTTVSRNMLVDPDVSVLTALDTAAQGRSQEIDEEAQRIIENPAQGDPTLLPAMGEAKQLVRSQYQPTEFEKLSVQDTDLSFDERVQRNIIADDALIRAASKAIDDRSLFGKVLDIGEVFVPGLGSLSKDIADAAKLVTGGDASYMNSTEALLMMRRTWSNMSPSQKEASVSTIMPLLLEAADNNAGTAAQFAEFMTLPESALQANAVALDKVLDAVDGASIFTGILKIAKGANAVNRLRKMNRSEDAAEVTAGLAVSNSEDAARAAGLTQPEVAAIEVPYNHEEFFAGVPDGMAANVRNFKRMLTETQSAVQANVQVSRQAIINNRIKELEANPEVSNVAFNREGGNITFTMQKSGAKPQEVVLGIDTKDEWNVLRTTGVGPIHANLSAPATKFSADADALVSTLTTGNQLSQFSAKLYSKVLKEHSKTVKKVKGKEREQLDNVISEGDRVGEEFTLAQIKEKGLTSEAAQEAYFQNRILNNYAHGVKSNQVLDGYVFEGYDQYMTIGKEAGVAARIIRDPVPTLQGIPTKSVWNDLEGVSSSAQRVTPELLEKYDAVLVKHRSPSPMRDGKHYTYSVVARGDLRKLEAPDVLPYRKGYVTNIHERAKYFVTSAVRGNVDGDPNALIRNKVERAFSSKKKMNDWIKEEFGQGVKPVDLKTVGQPSTLDDLVIKDGVVDAEATLAKLPEVPEGHVRLFRATSDEVKFDDVFDREKLFEFSAKDSGLRGDFWTPDIDYADYFRETFGKSAKMDFVDIPSNLAETRKLRGGEYIIDDATLDAAKAAAKDLQAEVPVRPGELPEGWATRFDREYNAVSKSEELGSMNGLFTGKRSESGLIVDGQIDSRMANPFDSVSKYYQDLANRGILDRYRAEMKQRWLNTYAGKVSPEFRNNFTEGMIGLERAGFKQGTEEHRAAKGLHDHIRGASGIKSTDEITSENFLREVSEQTEATNKLYLRLADEGSLTGKAKSIAFHLNLGILNASQLIVQGSGMAVSMGAHPVAFAKAQPKMLMSTLADASAAPLPKGRVHDLWRASGFRETVDMNADLAKASTEGKTGRFLSVFFRQGEMLNRRGAFYTMYEVLKSRKGRELTNDDLAELIGEANRMTLNFSQVNKAKWQDGFLGLLTQFQQVTEKSFNQIWNPLTFGKSPLTGMERAGAMAAQSMLFGLAGVPFGEYVVASLDKTVADSGMSPEDAEKWKQGIVGQLPLENNFSNRISMGQMHGNFYTKIMTGQLRLSGDMTDNLRKGMLGAFGGTVAKVMDGTEDIYRAVNGGDVNVLMKTIVEVAAKLPTSMKNLYILDAYRNQQLHLSARGRPLSKTDVSTIEQTFMALGFPIQEIQDAYQGQDIINKQEQFMREVVDYAIAAMPKGVEADNPEAWEEGGILAKMFPTFNGAQRAEAHRRIEKKLSRGDKTLIERIGEDAINKQWLNNTTNPVINEALENGTIR